MSNTGNESSQTIIELELKLFNILETGFLIIQSYLIWMYTKILDWCKINYFLNLVHILICNIKARLNNNNTQRRNLLEWIRTKVRGPHAPTNFNEDWKNGITLCALIEGVVPGSCPRFDLLSPDQPINNIKLGLTLVKKYLNIASPIESQEIHDCSEEAKLVYFLSRIKFESVKMVMKSILSRSIIEVKDSSGSSHKVFESLFGDQKACFAKGMGLILGVRARRARFNIFCKPTAKLNLMIEISGPYNSMCSERITAHNPKKRISTDVVTSSLITDVLNRRKTVGENLKIPFFYEVFPNKIVVTYIPLVKGAHKLSIVWQGQHIMHSPYTVNVEDNGAGSDRASEALSVPTSPTKFIPGLQYPVNALAKRDSLSFDETATVVGRKVLKQVVVVNGKEKLITDLNTGMGISNRFDDASNSNATEDMAQVDKSNDSETRENPSNLNCHNQTQLGLLETDFDSKHHHFDQTDHFVETNSIQSQLSSASEGINDEKNNQSISNVDNDKHNSEVRKTERKESINEMNDFEELSNVSQKSEVSQNSDLYDKCTANNYIQDDQNLSFKQQIATRPSSCTSQKVINNYSYRSFLPVKNMIQDWETKLSNNVCSNKENSEQNKIDNRIQYIPVKNRCRIFEQPKAKDTTTLEAENPYSAIQKEFRRHFSINDKRQFWEDLTTDTQNEQVLNNLGDTEEGGGLNEDKSDDSNRSLNGVNEDLTEQMITEDSNKSLKSSLEMLSTQNVVNTPESHPDSGISTNTFCDFKDGMFCQNLLRQKSHSYPDLNRLEKFCMREFDFFKDYNNDQNNTRTSSLVGQFIDDEIPDYTSLFLGEYVSYTGLLNTDRPVTLDDMKFDDLTDAEACSDTKKPSSHYSNTDIGIYPEKCQVFGAGVYYGQVGIKNHFVVSTKEGGKSFLAVGIQSAEQDDVIEVTVTSIGNKNYEVLYEVSRPGYYIIFVKWGDYNVADSPFICKVTY